MKQRLEDFVRRNKEAFDDQDPHEKIWRDITRRLPAFRESAWNDVSIWRAAAILFMAMACYLLVAGNFLQARDDQLAMNEFRDVEAYYSQLISEKVRLIDSYERPERLNGFTRDIHQLEAMYMVLKEQMQANPSRKVKEALVLNLLVRIDLLNQQLHRLDVQETKEEPRAS